jgi:hypothetical protein
MSGNNITNVLDVSGVTVTLTGGVKIGELNYEDSGAIVAATTQNGFYQAFLCQNKSSGVSASANVVCVNDSAGTDYAAMGINSSGFSNLYDTLFEIPNATYMSGTADTVIGAQSDHAVSSNACLYLTYNSGESAYCINTQGALSFNAARPGGVLNKGDFGTAGQTLVSGGSNAPPTWVDGFALSEVASLPQTITPSLQNKGTVYVYSGASGTLSFNNTNLSSNAGFFVVIKNSSTSGDITIATTPATISGIKTVYHGSLSSNGGVLYLYWTGTAWVGERLPGWL